MPYVEVWEEEEEDLRREAEMKRSAMSPPERLGPHEIACFVMLVPLPWVFYFSTVKIRSVEEILANRLQMLV